MFDAVFIPGGQDSIKALKESGDAIHFINEAYKHCKPIAALGDGLELLKECKLAGTTLPASKVKDAVNDKGVVIGSPDEMYSFVTEFIDAIAQHRHWNRQKIAMEPA